jgi:hypothetical protein
VLQNERVSMFDLIVSSILSRGIGSDDSKTEISLPIHIIIFARRSLRTN